MEKFDENGPDVQRFHEIVKHSNIRTVFQPIVSLRDGSPLGYEALSRGPDNTPFHNPETLFRLAGRCNMLWELERVCRNVAMESACRQEYAGKLFLNVNPNIMHDPAFQNGFTSECMTKYRINPRNIIFEITEKNAVTDIQGFKKAVEHYKNQNYEIAIDDAGAGYSGLTLISDIRPHFIKLDMQLIRGIDTDGLKRALVKGMYEFSEITNTLLIAEGIETLEELRVLVDIGIHYGQGYFIQRPSEVLRFDHAGAAGVISGLNAKKNRFYSNRLSNIYISNLCKPVQTVSPGTPAGDVHDMFLQNPALPGICVTEDDVVLGTITRNMLSIKLSGRYGYALYGNKKISVIMERNFLSVENQTPIDLVSRMAMARPSDNLYDFIVVTSNERYHGVVTIKDLLEKTMEMEVINAKHQNPLTGLPGNLIIEKYLEQAIFSPEPYCVAYFDLDHFKAYNDVYGFENGDSIIKLVSNILTEHVPREEFVGHIGGDDFIAIFSFHDAEDICRRIIADFDRKIRKYYNETDLRNGFIRCRNRNGEWERIPIISLSIAGVTNKNRQFGDIYVLTEYIGAIKTRCKQMPESVLLIE